MSKHPTTIRLDPQFYKDAQQKAYKSGLSFSNVVHLLLTAYIDGEIRIGVTQYPPRYLATLGKEADALRKQYGQGKVKSYASSKELFDTILPR